MRPAELRRGQGAGEAKLGEFAKAYETFALVSALFGSWLVVLLGEVATNVMGTATEFRPWERKIPWILTVLVTVSMVYVAWRVRSRDSPLVPRSYWVQAALQLIWMGVLAWYMTPLFVIVVAFLLGAAVFNDARYFYDCAAIRWSYASGWVLFALFLLGMDAVGGTGILTRFEQAPDFVVAALVLGACLAVLTQFLIRAVGRQWRKVDLEIQARSRLEAELAAARSERRVIARSCDLLARGLTAGRFSHDVTSPLSVGVMSLHDLRDGIGRLETGGSESERAQALALLRDAVDELGQALEMMLGMAQSMARSLRGQGKASPMNVPDLAGQAVERMRMIMRRYDVPFFEPRSLIPPARVFATEDHIAALADIMANGARRTRGPIELTGRPWGPWYYGVFVRDFGLEGVERDAALARIQVALALDDDTALESEDEDPRMRGLGVGLTTAKLLFLRQGGWVGAATPKDGAGILVLCLFPRVDPEMIPPDEDPPEKVARAMLAVSR